MRLTENPTIIWGCPCLLYCRGAVAWPGTTRTGQAPAHMEARDYSIQQSIDSANAVSHSSGTSLFCVS